jgi:hypothetical protein
MFANKKALSKPSLVQSQDKLVKNDSDASFGSFTFKKDLPKV